MARSKKMTQRSLVGFEDSSSKPPGGVSRSEKVDADKSVASTAEDLTGKTVYAVDTHALLFQVFHALPEMSSPNGQPVGAVFGFARDLVRLLDEKKPDYLFCAFDLPGPTFRHQMYDQYKIDRGEMPETLRPQIGLVKSLLEALRVPVLECESYEADDVLATLARRCDQLGADCYIVTSDKDCRQLITDRVKLFDVRKDRVMDAQALEQDWGIRPDQVVDFQALVGDPVDSVPGVPLIGPKLARQLLGEYGTLESVLDHAEEVSGAKRKQNLLEGRQQALLSRQLVRLVDDVPIAIDFPAGQVGGFDAAVVGELFREFGFQSLANRFREMASSEAPSQWEAEYTTVDTREALKQLVADLASQPRFALDTETTSRHPRLAELVGLSFSWVEGQAYYVPVRGPDPGRCLDPSETLRMLRPVLEDASIGKVGQNLKYDMIVLRSAGVDLKGLIFDTMIAAYLLEAGQRDHGLDSLARTYLNYHEKIKYVDLVGSGKNQKGIEEVPVDEVTQYAGEDADVTWRLASILQQRLEQEGLFELFRTVELPLVDVLVDMEYAGIKIDVARLAELSREYGARMDQLEQEVYELAESRFNISSPKQLAQVLFEQHDLPVIKRNKTGPSTDASVLEELAEQHPLPAKIIEYRQFAKLKNTYVDTLPELVHPHTGRVHTSFNQVVAATGRLSSNDPNLQNIPVRTREGREIRAAFLAGQPAWHLMAADYSQIELRVLAHFSGDKTLCSAFTSDQDIHAQVASQVYDVPLDGVTGSMRHSAKAINFGVIYGQSPFGLARTLGIEHDEAAAFIDAYFARYPGVDQFLEQILAECYVKGYVQTILGRRRAIQGVRDRSHAKQSHRQRTLPERTAINTVIQGSAADLIKQAMIAVPPRLARDGIDARMLIQIHDELIFEVPSAQVQELASVVSEEMSTVGQLSVSLKVDIKSGRNWAQCEPLE